MPASWKPNSAELPPVSVMQNSLILPFQSCRAEKRWLCFCVSHSYSIEFFLWIAWHPLFHPTPILQFSTLHCPLHLLFPNQIRHVCFYRSGGGYLAFEQRLLCSDGPALPHHPIWSWPLKEQTSRVPYGATTQSNYSSCFCFIYSKHVFS